MRYFIDSDDSGHWYLIPVENHKEWDEWRNLSENDYLNEKYWNPPEFVHKLPGSPNNITFTDPIYE